MVNYRAARKSLITHLPRNHCTTGAGFVKESGSLPGLSRQRLLWQLDYVLPAFRSLVVSSIAISDSAKARPLT